MCLRDDFFTEAQELPVDGAKTTKRKDVPVAPSAQEHEQCRAEGPAGHGVPEKHGHAAEDVEA